MQSKEALQENQYHFPYHHLAHEKNGALYVFRHLFWGLEHYTYINFVISKIIDEKPNQLMDVGCGEGRIIQELEKSNLTTKFTGTDISSRAISFANAFSNKSDFFVHNILTEPTETKYDLIVSCEVIEHIEPESVTTYIKNICESMSQKGKIIITTPTTNVPTNSKHYQHFTAEMFDNLLEDFEDIKYEYLNVSNRYSWILNRILANRLFISNSFLLNRFVLKSYKKRLLFGTKKTGSRIVVTATRKY